MELATCEGGNCFYASTLIDGVDHLPDVGLREELDVNSRQLRDSLNPLFELSTIP